MKFSKCLSVENDSASRTPYAKAAIFLGARTVFGFTRFGLSMGMFLSFILSQDKENAELTVLLFFQNP